MVGQGKYRRTGRSRLRRAVQAVCLAAFVSLALAAAFQWYAPVPRDLFLRFDPLVWLLSSVASRELAVHALPALALVAATVLWGRMFCGWVCPLGTVIDGAHAISRHQIVVLRFLRWTRVRFWVLAALAGAAIVGVNLASWFDPLVFSSRGLLFVLDPGTRGTAAVLGCSAAAAAIVLTWLAPRFWCRILCPLGALLSLVSWAGRYHRRVAESCNECGLCSAVCPMGQSPCDSSPIDCIACHRCEAACPKAAVDFGFRPPLQAAGAGAVPSPEPDAARLVSPADLLRRQLFLGLFSGLAGIGAGAAVGGLVGVRRNPVPLRPPGAGDERSLAASCVGCGICLAVCPTGGLLPLVAPGRLDAVFTPQFVPRVGPCLPECAACGRACPTGAIPKLPVEEKAAVRMGTAVIDHSTCLAWAVGQRCVICVDACPERYHAIELWAILPRTFRPVVIPSRCTGCGICEHRCPVHGAAIRVVLPPSHG